ncbi:MAG: hypothetical protein LAO79_03565 [Acidobacteriia bacterium]|nr:hypothetical protein [Terriglobia bacterium]
MVTCGECSFPIPAEAWNREDGALCPGCRQRILAAVFPSMERSRAGAVPEQVAEATEASCFFHPQSRASVPCSHCGRFLCNLCDIELDGAHLCPSCFRAGVKKKKIESVETQRVMYDSIALAAATLPALLFWPVIFGAPAALYITIRRWRTPLSILPRTRIRFVLAAIFALAEIGAVAFVVWTIVRLPRLGVAPR